MTPRQQLEEFIDRYSPEVAKAARATLRRLQKRHPGAARLVYDNYNALVVGFGPSERASEAVLSVALYPSWVTLFFLKGTALKDPQQRLKGSGNQVRWIKVEGDGTLEDPDVLRLVDEAAAQGGLGATGPAGPLIIKSISAKQRPRRP